jgi:hypothetical protein
MRGIGYVDIVEGVQSALAGAAARGSRIDRWNARITGEIVLEKGHRCT